MTNGNDDTKYYNLDTKYYHLVRLDLMVLVVHTKQGVSTALTYDHNFPLMALHRCTCLWHECWLGEVWVLEGVRIKWFIILGSHEIGVDTVGLSLTPFRPLDLHFEPPSAAIVGLL